MTTKTTTWSKGMLEEEAELTAMMERLDDHEEKYGLDPSKNDPKQIELLRQAAKEYNVRKTVTFRPQARVLASFQMRANKEGIPYQALLNSVMKKYAEG